MSKQARAFLAFLLCVGVPGCAPTRSKPAAPHVFAFHSTGGVLRVSIDGELATGAQVQRLLVALNGDERVRRALSDALQAP